jgi:hypothetical protein
MTGPIPKESSIRARRNKQSTASVLRAVPGAKVPSLPKGKTWHGMTMTWWGDIWRSPMAPEFADSDFHGVARLAYLVDAYYRAADADDARLMLSLSAEIRLQGQSFGLTPIDRRRLQWTIEQGEAAEEKTTQRRKARAETKKPRAVAADPRELLA